MLYYLAKNIIIENMKKIFAFLIALTFLSTVVYADDWDDYIEVDEAAKSQQKTVTKDEFEKVLKQFKNKREEKAKQKLKKKMGESRMPKDENFSDLTILNNMYDAYPTLMVPADLITADYKEIPAGFYRIMSVKKEDSYFMNFYQGNSIIARVPSIVTDNDYNQESLNYAKIIPISDKEVKFIYGDIDCNLEAVLFLKPVN